MRQTSALAVKEKHQIQLIHSRTEPRPPGMALRMRSSAAPGPRSFVIKWLSRKVANDPKTKMSQVIFPSDMRHKKSRKLKGESRKRELRGILRREDGGRGCDFERILV